MKNRSAWCAALAGACLLLIVFAYAGPKNFWEAKPYTEWTAAEVQKILQKDCPWTRLVLLVPTEAASGGKSKGSPNPTYSTPIYINWNSRIVREAVVRKAMLETPNTPKEQIDQALNYQPKHIEFFVNGPVQGGGRGGGRGGASAEFKEKTFLQKKNKEKIPLEDVVAGGGRGGGSMTLLFPLEVNGKPTIGPEDKEITLVIRIGESDYKFVFKMADMMVQGKLEI
jgi:hypothetical protein